MNQNIAVIGMRALPCKSIDGDLDLKVDISITEDRLFIDDFFKDFEGISGRFTKTRIENITVSSSNGDVVQGKFSMGECGIRGNTLTVRVLHPQFINSEEAL